MTKHERCKRWMRDTIMYNEDFCDETVEDAKYILELLDRAESKKPEFEVNDGEYEVFNCNICNDIIPTYIYEPNFCPNCGQKLDKQSLLIELLSSQLEDNYDNRPQCCIDNGVDNPFMVCDICEFMVCDDCEHKE